MNVVIPMAGRGHRFAASGYGVPKPLIPVHGVPMYAWAVAGLPLDLATRVVFVCLREHVESTELGTDIRERLAPLQPFIVVLEDVTQGQACTVLAARDTLDPDASLLVYNADTYARTTLAIRLPVLEAEADGVIGVFEAEGDRWSFARLDERGNVVETAEKRRISSWATTGLYHFTRTGDFFRLAEEAIVADERVGEEFYIAPLYNRMIRSGARVVADVAEEVWVLGTPEDLARFEREGPASFPGIETADGLRGHT